MEKKCRTLHASEGVVILTLCYYAYVKLVYTVFFSLGVLWEKLIPTQHALPFAVSQIYSLGSWIFICIMAIIVIELVGFWR